MAATSLAAAGLVLAVRDAVTPPSTATASLAGVTLAPGDAGWTAMAAHHMDGQAGYQMPAQMMPGAPEGGDMRLGVPVTLVNSGHTVRALDLVAEVSLAGGRIDGRERPHSDTIGRLARLAPGTAVHGVLYFDTIVPGPDDPPLYLTWERDGGVRRLELRISGDATGHHGHG
ncbi:hypothetical protein ACIBO1_29830 [Micromonospora sp. NPDC049903]|uniref:hypothetical protein n=1 Tax=Micromonospora sp. NPDC049903 TaxID=3364276 RepID=UPI0037B65B05